MSHQPVRHIVLTDLPLTLAQCSCGRTGDLAWMTRHMSEQDRGVTA